MRERVIMLGRIVRRIGLYVLLSFLFPYAMTLCFCDSVQWFDEPQQTEEVRYVKTDYGLIPLEEYICGALPALICTDYHAEMLKCMAVLVRTDICAMMGDSAVISESELPFEYMTGEEIRALPLLGGADARIGYETCINMVEAAVAETSGELFYYEETLQFLEFCAAGNGSVRIRSEDGSERIVACESDYMADGALWSVCRSGEEFAQYLLAADMIASDEAAQYSALRAEELTLTYDTAGYVVSVNYGEQTEWEGRAFAEALSLPSESFYIRDFNGALRFVGSGIGGGYGLSQYHAWHMAQEGASYQEILEYFYCK